MWKKRKQPEKEVSVKKEETAPERPKRTLLGWKDKDTKVEEKQQTGDSPFFRNKEKLLVTCSRRLSYRKGKDLYIWAAKSPNEPSVKFLVDAVHTMEDLKLTGNHLKGSRPLLTFSSNFGKDAHWMMLKELLIQISVPHNETDKVDHGGLNKMTLVEVDPRFYLNPIKIFAGSFGGPTIYDNPYYISPNEKRAAEKRKKAGKYAIKAKTRRKAHEQDNPLQPDEYADMWRGE